MIIENIWLNTKFYLVNDAEFAFSFLAMEFFDFLSSCSLLLASTSWALIVRLASSLASSFAISWVQKEVSPVVLLALCAGRTC